MSGEPWIELAQSWGVPQTSPIEALSGRVAAANWRHAEPAFDDATLTTNILVYVAKLGASTFHRGGRSFKAPCAVGAMGLLPTGLYGRWTFGTPIEVTHIYLPDDLLADVAAGAGAKPVLDERLHLEDALLSSLAAETRRAMNDGQAARLYVDTLGTAIAMRLLRCCSTLSGSRAIGKAKGGLAPWQINRITDYLCDHLADDVSLADLAALVDLSTHHLCRAFKASTGLPPHRWRHQRRIERACELLERTDLPVSDVAAAVGYDDPSQLAAAFRKTTGVSPTHYRRERRR